MTPLDVSVSVGCFYALTSAWSGSDYYCDYYDDGYYDYFSGGGMFFIENGPFFALHFFEPIIVGSQESYRTFYMYLTTDSFILNFC